MKTIITYLTSFLFILIASQTYAETCYQQSPNLIDNGDTYYNIENSTPFPSNDQIALATLFNQITGQWQGNVITFECYGTDKDAYSKTKTGNIKTQHLFDGTSVMTLNNEVNFDEDITTASSNILMPQNIFNLNIIDDKHLLLAQKIRRGTVSNGVDNRSVQLDLTSRLIEIIFDFHLHNSQYLTIKQSVYSNGVFTYSETWSLYR